MLYVFLGFAVFAALLFLIAAFRPSQFRISRSAKIAATPATLFGKVNDLKEFQTWNPWAKIDPNSKNTFEGSASGVGSIFRWDGNREVGAGSMTITDSRPHDQILIQMDFLKPFKGTNYVEFTFVPDGNQTEISWIMTGRYNFMVKIIGLFLSMEKMIGGQFEKGLATLKSEVEATERRLAS